MKGVAGKVSVWVEERCHQREGIRTNTSDLHQDYTVWIERQGLKPFDLRAFGRALSGLGFEPWRAGRRNGWAGISPKSAGEPKLAEPPMWQVSRSLRKFLEVRAVIEPDNPGLSERTTDIHSMYSVWAKKAGEPAITCRTLGYTLGRIGLGLRHAEVRYLNGWKGIRLLGVGK